MILLTTTAQHFKLRTIFDPTFKKSSALQMQQRKSGNRICCTVIRIVTLLLVIFEFRIYLKRKSISQ